MLIHLIWSETYYSAKHCCRLVWYFVKCVNVQNTSKIKDFLENACQRLTYHSFNWIAFSCLNPATNVFLNIFRKVARRSKRAVAYPELVSGGFPKVASLSGWWRSVPVRVTPPDLKKTTLIVCIIMTMRWLVFRRNIIYLIFHVHNNKTNTHLKVTLLSNTHS